MVRPAPLALAAALVLFAPWAVRAQEPSRAPHGQLRYRLEGTCHGAFAMEGVESGGRAPTQFVMFWQVERGEIEGAAVEQRPSGTGAPWIAFAATALTRTAEQGARGLDGKFYLDRDVPGRSREALLRAMRAHFAGVLLESQAPEIAVIKTDSGALVWHGSGTPPTTLAGFTGSVEDENLPSTGRLPALRIMLHYLDADATDRPPLDSPFDLLAPGLQFARPGSIAVSDPALKRFQPSSAGDSFAFHGPFQYGPGDRPPGALR